MYSIGVLVLTMERARLKYELSTENLRAGVNLDVVSVSS
jgi:hypothetical protein